MISASANVALISSIFARWSATVELISPLMKYFERSSASSAASVVSRLESSSRISSAGIVPESAL